MQLEHVHALIPNPTITEQHVIHAMQHVEHVMDRLKTSAFLVLTHL